MWMDNETRGKLIGITSAGGPVAVETWHCPQCQGENLSIHHFEEVLRCGYCRIGRVASQVNVYGPGDLDGPGDPSDTLV